VIRGFLIMIGCAFIAGVIGFSYGATREITPANSGLADFADAMGVRVLAAFVRVRTSTTPVTEWGASLRDQERERAASAA
jgi:hypothetical protein